jgi:hypothetical protein
MVLIASCWQTRQHVIIRTLLLVAVLAAAMFGGLLAYSKSGRGQQAPAATCTVAACVTTDPTLPGGWPVDPNRVP